MFDQKDQCFKTGSGVIISDKGYVLTNLHVVNGGRYYGILLEEETDVFYTLPAPQTPGASEPPPGQGRLDWAAGRLQVGLITAGYDDGQNLNLAVDYQTISQFVRGLL